MRMRNRFPYCALIVNCVFVFGCDCPTNRNTIQQQIKSDRCSQDETALQMGDNCAEEEIVLAAKRYVSTRLNGREVFSCKPVFSARDNVWHVYVEFSPRVPGGHVTLVVSPAGVVQKEIKGL